MHKENYVKRNAGLPKLEISAYFVCWLGSVLYSIYKLKLASNAFNYIDDVYNDFSDGWSIIGRRRDSSDYEWENFKRLLFHVTPWLIFHVITSECIRVNNLTRHLPCFHVITTISYVIYNSNVKILIVMLYQPVVFEIFSKFNSKSVIWLCGLFNLLILHHFKEYGFNESFFKFMDISDVQHSMTILGVYWIHLRCLCYYLDEIGNSSKILMVAYCLYLPLVYFGPFVPYRDYEKSLSKCDTSLKIRLKVLVLGILRYVFWFFVVEICLHYVYVNAFSFQGELVEKFDSWTLYGYGYAMGQFFHMKYVVLYGLSTSLAKFDNIPVPSTPKCIGRIHLYSDMWKHFDSGLYTFLLRYIYIPILDVSPKWFKLPANLICFLFVYLWHGFLQDHILVWVLLNCVAVSLEMLFKAFYKSHLAKRLSFVSGRWERRFGCVLAAPLLAVSAMSNFCFFAGMKIGGVFFKRFFADDDAEATFYLLFFLYCCCQVSVEIKKWENMKPIKNKMCF